MRRRLRAQSRVREALLLDLGATVWELHRHGRREPDLLQAKASHLAVVDDEVRGLAEALEGGHGIDALVERASRQSARTAPRCSHPDSRYCPACGTAVVQRARSPRGGAVERDTRNGASSAAAAAGWRAAVAAPPRGTTAARHPAPMTEIVCPECGAPADSGQLVCLECGARIALARTRSDGWRRPVAIVAIVGCSRAPPAALGYQAPGAGSRGRGRRRAAARRRRRRSLSAG